MSLDGFVAGPRQSIENPLGIGGMRLHEWAFALQAWRAQHGLEGGEVDVSTKVVDESVANIGATIMGRNMFGGHPGGWSREKPWNGWWGENPPFHHPVFVLTHHPREPLVLEGRNKLHVCHEWNRGRARTGAPRRAREGRIARGRSEGRAAISCGGTGRRDGDQSRADAIGQRRAAFRRAWRRSARVGTRANRRRTQSSSPQIREALRARVISVLQ